MKKIFFIISTVLLLAGTAHAHGSISKLPDSVQILQYKMKLHMNANDMGVRNNLAMAYFRTGQFVEAKKELEYVLEKDASNFDALDGMGLVLMKMGQNKEACRFFEQAEVINPKDVLLHVHRAINYKNLKKPKLAEEEMTKVRSLANESEREEIDQEIVLLTSSLS